MLEVGGSAEGIEKTLASVSPSSTAVPSVLHAPLMARLDRLGPRAKEIAQIAAAIGREFSYQLLAPVAARSTDDLEEALGRLSDAGLVFSRGIPPAATYTFKHALSATRLMQACCAAAAKSCTHGSRPFLKNTLPTSWSINPSSWQITVRSAD